MDKIRIREIAVRLVELIAHDISVNPRSSSKRIATWSRGTEHYHDRLAQIVPDMDEWTWWDVLVFMNDDPKFRFFYNQMTNHESRRNEGAPRAAPAAPAPAPEQAPAGGTGMDDPSLRLRAWRALPSYPRALMRVLFPSLVARSPAYNQQLMKLSDALKGLVADGRAYSRPSVEAVEIEGGRRGYPVMYYRSSDDRDGS